MKIAIVGAGIAGVTCATELHKLGHEVEIFEKSAKRQQSRPRQMEGAAYFLGNIPEIETPYKMRSIEIHSAKFESSLEGNLGFFYQVGGKEGIDERAREKAEKLLPVHYSSKIATQNQLQDKFQKIVAADGYHSTIAKTAGLLVSKTPRLIGCGVGYTVEGNFDPQGMEIWFDERYARNGYAYLIPFSKKEASLVSASVAGKVNASIYHQRLKELAELKNWYVGEGWVDFECWYDFQTYATDKVLVIGDAGSFTEQAFGFGLKWAVKTAKLCAEAIDKDSDYNQIIHREIAPEFEHFQIMRRFFETAENKDYDWFVKSFKNPLIKILARSRKSLVRTYAKKLKGRPRTSSNI